MSFWEKKVFDVFEAFLEAHENIPISFWENCDESADWGRADPGVPVKVFLRFFIVSSDFALRYSITIFSIKN